MKSMRKYLIRQGGGIILMDYILSKYCKINYSKYHRFSWESAYTGLDVTPDCCPEVKLYQLHVTGDIGFAGKNI